MCFLIPQPEDMLTLPLNFTESQLYMLMNVILINLECSLYISEILVTFIFSIFNTCSIYILSDSQDMVRYLISVEFEKR